ncbi:hypothetical protein SISSUDRAFT_56121 [Sistotremastrum suecicum HHB10207 ss-3]|uniref:Uncharacterized protein n=1 Tax=Sistotremastrum suecicum HHB10207 ss-3 TaxID=1314776 RepID=A0A166BQ95_9AGAM|nr:hypothetical protein SISSUDRAFT_56121 [Sistotremastrum suecicum HHB10207 ss-3]
MDSSTYDPPSIADCDFFLSFSAQNWWPDDPEYQVDASEWLRNTPRTNPLRYKFLELLVKLVKKEDTDPALRKKYRAILAEQALELVTDLVSSSTVDWAKTILDSVSTNGVPQRAPDVVDADNSTQSSGKAKMSQTQD